MSTVTSAKNSPFSVAFLCLLGRPKFVLCLHMAKSKIKNAFRHVSRSVFALGTVRSVGEATSTEKLF